MKRFLGFLMAVWLIAFAATPAFAQGPGYGDFFCTGGNTVVRSEDTADSVLLFGCNAVIQSNARVLKDIVSFGGNVTIDAGARVEHDVVAFGGNVHSAGEVRHDILTFGGNVTLDQGAVVGRDVTTFGGLIDQKPGATVRGRINSATRFAMDPLRFAPFSFPFAFGGGLAGLLTSTAFGFVRSIIYALALAALGALTVVFLPAQTKQVGDVAEKSALPSLGVGCLTLFVFVLLFLLLLVLIITIPVALLMPFALAIAGLFGWIAVGRVIGEKVMVAVKAQPSWREPVIVVAVGIILLAIITALPLFGWLIGLFVCALGLGAVILTRFGTRPYPMTYVPAVAPSAPATPAAPSTPAQSSESAPAAPGDPGPSI